MHTIVLTHSEEYFVEMKEGSLSLSLSLDSRLQTPESPYYLLVRAQTPSTFPSPQKGREGTLEAQFRGTLRSAVAADYVIFFFTKP
jgi:hypothetical protein